MDGTLYGFLNLGQQAIASLQAVFEFVTTPIATLLLDSWPDAADWVGAHSVLLGLTPAELVLSGGLLLLLGLMLWDRLV